jgi:hypothetical protein
MREFETLGEERLLVAAGGEGVVTLCISHPWFGRIATIRLDLAQTSDLVTALFDVDCDGLADAA